MFTFTVISYVIILCMTDLNLSSSPSLLCSQEVLYPLRVQVVVLNEAGVPMTCVPDPLGAPVVAVALEDDAGVKHKLLIAQELLYLGWTLGKHSEDLTEIVSV